LSPALRKSRNSNVASGHGGKWERGFKPPPLLSRVTCVDEGLMFRVRCNWILGEDGEAHEFTPRDQEMMVRTVIEPMASDGLRTICLAYKDYVKGTFTLYLNAN